MEPLVETDRPWIVKTLAQHSDALPFHSGWLQGLVGKPPGEVASELKSRDFLFLERHALEDRHWVLSAAECLIDLVPSLRSAIRTTVAAVFLLSAREEFDISHSEPRWRSWIFVSAPHSRSIVSALRLAENVVHEAMHLQLTDLEMRMPLVADTVSKLHSPWKQEPRQLQGILHGLYVCACISAFLRTLIKTGTLPEEGIGHVHRRIDSIREEIGDIPLDRLADGLTVTGRQFLKSIEGWAPTIVGYK